ncbi:exodeoxyribonuclease VII small subunit [Calderihabitans maritimus]|uniref:Exodeoxyribonuclease 7 small subunit n=1 Tax=Calderihabitans maritimus TaxID=1246530 RepID=A0A1Z5HXD0_9FIRM|nr:exodeoxyribonuclease VII small subunit [Calderihabitans maritimus]GAW94186.1 hypothetical protein ETSY2_08725 [Calderihabitans maritimus]
MAEIKDLTFEQALERLEKIVRALETGNLSLEDSLQHFEEGIKLIKFCNHKLEAAERKVSLLVEKADGELVLEAFQEQKEDGVKE